MSDIPQNAARAAAFMDAMHALKGQLGEPYTPSTLQERYEALREQYATGRIDLEDFTAAVVSLLREGF